MAINQIKYPEDQEFKFKVASEMQFFTDLLHLTLVTKNLRTRKYMAANNYLVFVSENLSQSKYEFADF